MANDFNILDQSYGGSVANLEQATYRIFKSGSTYYAKQSVSGALEFSGSDLATVWDSVIATLTSDIDITDGLNHTGGLILFDPGVYNVARALKHSVWGLRVSGATFGGGTVLYQSANLAAAGDALLMVGDEAGSTLADIPQKNVIENLHFVGRLGTYANGRGVVLCTNSSLMRDCTIQNMGDEGLVLTGLATPYFGYSQRVADVDVVNCVGSGVVVKLNSRDTKLFNVISFHGSALPTFGGYGFDIQGGTIHLLKCHAYYNREHGFYVNGSGETVWFEHCVSENNGGWGMYINGPNDCWINGCEIYSNGRTTVADRSAATTEGAAEEGDVRVTDSRYLRVTNNRMFKGSTSTPNILYHVLVDGTDSDYFEVSGNAFRDCQAEHVRINNCDGGGRVINNDFEAPRTTFSVPGLSPTYALRLTGSTAKVQVQGNRFHQDLLDDSSGGDNAIVANDWRDGANWRVVPLTTIIGPQANERYVQDDFSGALIASDGNIGDLGWTKISHTNPGAMTIVAAEAGHMGIKNIACAGTGAGDWYAIKLGQGTTINGFLISTDPWTVTFMFKVVQTDSNTIMRVGLYEGNPTTSGPPTSGVYLEKDAADTNWFAVTRAAAGTPTRVDTGVAVVTGWHRVSLRREAAGEVQVSLNGAAWVPVTATIPSGDLSPFMQIASGASIAAKSMMVDLMQARLRMA